MFCFVKKNDDALGAKTIFGDLKTWAFEPVGSVPSSRVCPLQPGGVVALKETSLIEMLHSFRACRFERFPLFFLGLVAFKDVICRRIDVLKQTT